MSWFSKVRAFFRKAKNNGGVANYDLGKGSSVSIDLRWLSKGKLSEITRDLDTLQSIVDSKEKGRELSQEEKELLVNLADKAVTIGKSIAQKYPDSVTVSV